MALGSLLGGGGGGGGGGGDFGGTAVIGAIGGTITGAVEGAAASRAAAKNRRRFRKGVRLGEAEAQREAFDILSSPEIGAARDFIRGTFGLPTGAGPGGTDGGVNIGGRTFSSRPSGVSLERGRKQAVRLGAQLGKALRAQSEIESGFSASGRALSDKAIRKRERFIDARRGRFERFGDASEGFQQAALDRAGQFGFNREDIEGFLGGGEPQVSGGVTLDDPSGAAVADEADSQLGSFGLNSPLARDFATQLQAAQRSRGTFFGKGPAAQEAGALAAFNFQQQQAMLPQLFNLATLGSNITSRLTNAAVGRNVQQVSGGTAVFGAANPFEDVDPTSRALRGGLAGFLAGSAVDAAGGTQNSPGGGGAAPRIQGSRQGNSDFLPAFASNFGANQQPGFGVRARGF